MILLWNGEKIEAVDLDKVIPGPRAEEIARLLEPGYLHGYLAGRSHDVGIRDTMKKGRLSRDYRQIRRLMSRPASEPPIAPPWRYAMYLKEKLLEVTTSEVVTEVVTNPVKEKSTARAAVSPEAARAVDGAAVPGVEIVIRYALICWVALQSSLLPLETRSITPVSQRSLRPGNCLIFSRRQNGINYLISLWTDPLPELLQKPITTEEASGAFLSGALHRWG